MKQLLSLLAVFLFLTGCVQPLSRTDPVLYQQYKYWETGREDWHPVDGFDVLAARTNDDGLYSLRLTAHRDGLPTLRTGYIEASQKVAFQIMTAQCGAQNYLAQNAPKLAKGRTLDRYFYQNEDLSVGITYRCRGEQDKPTYDFLQTEQRKWNGADRKWDKINGIKAVVDTLPVSNDDVHQIKIRLFGGDANDNRRLSRRMMINTCQTNNFKVLFAQPAFDMIPAGRPPEIISNENVWSYGFRCYW